MNKYIAQNYRLFCDLENGWNDSQNLKNIQNYCHWLHFFRFATVKSVTWYQKHYFQGCKNNFDNLKKILMTAETLIIINLLK